MSVGAVRTCNRVVTLTTLLHALVPYGVYGDSRGVVTLPTGVGAVRTSKRVAAGMSPETEPPPVGAWRQRRRAGRGPATGATATPGRQEPEDGAATGPGLATEPPHVGACRSEPCDSAAVQGGGQRWGRRRRTVGRSLEMEPPQVRVLR